MKKFSLFVVVAWCFYHHAAAQADTVQWNVMMGGNKVGFQKQLKNADGTFTEWFQYNDRGRGDSTVSRYRLNDQGYITWIDARGKDYYKKPVFETFRLENGVASWENSAEKEQRKVTGNVSYVPLKINSGTSYAAFFTATDHTLTLLPSGRQKLTVLKDHVLGDGKKVTLVSLSGTGLTPQYVWLDERHQFFAIPSDWFSVMPKGYENTSDELRAIQDTYRENFYKELEGKLANRITTGIAVVHATLFDPKTGSTQPNSTLLIENGMITRVGAGKSISVPTGFHVVDAQNKFVMPGLWDMHVHYGEGTDGLLEIGTGVTNVRDMGNGESLLEKKKQIDEDLVPGPRIQAMCGFIDGAGPYAGPTGAKINSAEEGVAAVKKYKSLGYTQVKLYSSLKPEWVKPIAAEAHKNGMRVSGHIPAHMLASEAIDAGYDEIQHMNMFFLNFLGKDLDTRTPVRFHAVAQNAATLNFNSAEVKAFIKKMADKKIVLDPTISFFETMFVLGPGKPQPTIAAVIDRLPLDMQRQLSSSGALDIPAGQEATYAKSFQNMLRMVKVLHDNGVTIVPGTDDIPGFVLHTELENYARAGISNAAVLKIATLQSATVAGKDKLFGSLEAGKTSDIIIIDGNPLTTMSDIRKVETVIKGQKIYKTKDVLEAISIR
ncbi:amidohydrolase family protein [Chryseolinea lacunae]|uniref:Amidohydrolase family protein n=1 Tax=Chryseolinea lacunae TaxID=2801331 RepID=A0ABS1KWP0_9BACT|nr:amidohydrolase family protein [Chryseolinea lacunae]MBL0743879.1 amidohydrolase family protein [Chryseolinea lacunae]